MYYKMNYTNEFSKAYIILWLILSLVMIAGFGYGMFVLFKK